MGNMVIPGKMLIDDAAQEFESGDLLNEGVAKCNLQWPQILARERCVGGVLRLGRT